MHDIAEYLRAHEPFAGLEEAELGQLAARTEVEFFTAGEVIFRQGEPGLGHVRIIRRGAVELVDRGRVLDLLGEGEWFGHPAMLSGLPTGWAARAAEDSLCYRLAADDVVPLLSRPAGLRFVARSLMERPRRGQSALPDHATVSPDLPARALIHEQLVTCDPDTPIRDAARRMAEARASCALVTLGDGKLGIVTDYDLRVRVVAEGLSVDTPVSRVMSAPAFTARGDSLGTELMLAMVERGVRHLPIESERGELIGVATDVDLLAAEARAPLVVRRAVDAARDLDELHAAAARLRPTVVALHDAHVGAQQIGAIMASVADAVVRREFDLRLPDQRQPPFAWFSLGSYGRREPAPSSDADSGLTWEGDVPAQLAAIAREVVEDLGHAGFPADPHGATAANPPFARSETEWRSAIRHWLEHPSGEKVLIAVSLLVDGRVVVEHGAPADVLGMLAEGRHNRPLLRLLRRLANAHRPPTGFMRNIVVEHGGSHGGRFDIKRGGLLPIVNIARYGGMAAGATSASTPERLRAAAADGILRETDAGMLEEAFDLFAALRLEHQIGQLRAGDPPDNFIDPRSFNRLTRRYVREAFRVVTSVQRALSAESVYD